MTLSDLQTLIGSLTNDPNHDRYSLTDINTELDNVMDLWNIRARIIRYAVTLTVVDGTRQYAISSLTGTAIDFPRATHKGLLLQKKSRSWFDHYAGGTDWTQTIGTPKYFAIEAQNPDAQYITVFPTPQSGDVGANLVIDYIRRHTSMSASSDVPFMVGTSTNSLLRPYDNGVGYHTAARLLTRDPSPINAPKVQSYNKISEGVLDDVIQVFSALEDEAPPRIGGGRYWQSGYIRKPK